MSRKVACLASTFTACWLGSCASFNFVHDPQAVVPTREQIPDLLKSIRCELTTFYEANRQRSSLYKIYKDTKPPELAKNRRDAIEKYSYFEVSENLFAAVYLDLKVVDSFRLCLAVFRSAIDERVASPTRAHCQAVHISPTLNT